MSGGPHSRISLEWQENDGLTLVLALRQRG
jgi:hypothetical protein